MTILSLKINLTKNLARQCFSRNCISKKVWYSYWKELQELITDSTLWMSFYLNVTVRVWLCNQ